ncbi:hypothetical protein [Vitreoscilla filiformis]|uniref:hypothetical protein n=1 Tax=Vitreoscilla filiformis TaxID=63 RepID=UPI000B7A1BC4|nr:hypothetical protein [Vitreoscilla filiformis]
MLDSAWFAWHIPTAGTPQTTLAIVHSQKSAAVAEITCEGEPIIVASTGTLYTKKGDACPKVGAPQSLAQFYATAWYRENTLTDLAYLTGITATDATKSAQIAREFSATEPKTPDEKTSICPANQTYWSSLAECHPTDLIALYNQAKNETKIYTPDGVIDGELTRPDKDYRGYKSDTAFTNVKSISISEN